MKANYNPISVIGLMSGTSCDGLDIAYCDFEKKNGVWAYKVHEAETIEYPISLLQQLKEAMNYSALDIIALDRAFGKYCAEQVLAFLKKYQLTTPQLIASHGHTIFHNPSNDYTYQLGSGASLYAKTNIPAVCDFRSVDVALGGQGAPLVPIGDALLFNDYTYCLNLGGISNISYWDQSTRKAFDICPINMILNELAQREGFEYDDAGNMARQGTIIPELLNGLNALNFYQLNAPKSLGKEWFDTSFKPIMDTFKTHETKHLLATCVEHMAQQMAFVIKKVSRSNKETLLATGGGAFNVFLIEQFQKQLKEVCQIIVPDKKIVSFKEAIIFAFLGALNAIGEHNVWHSTTGSQKNHIGGALYGHVNFND
jgi:anhydro-N-acetylmuramic acid kinase